MTEPQRIVSLLPSATEIVFALGAGDRLVGVTHECDYPAGVRQKAVVVRAALQLENMNAAEIDRAVTEQLSSGSSIYNIDLDLLRDLQPDLLITQDLCAVCAPAANDLAAAVAKLPSTLRIVTLTPHSLADVLDNVREIGDAIGCRAEADALLSGARQRLTRIREITAPLDRPRVFCMEWTDPVYCSGHWVPEMVEIGGGHDALGRIGHDSVRIEWNDVLAFAPEILVVMPCGYDLPNAQSRAAALSQLPGWDDLPAVKSKRAFVADANSYFARPGPRLIDGLELLAHLLHPGECDWKGAPNAFARLH